MTEELINVVVCKIANETSARPVTLQVKLIVEIKAARQAKLFSKD